MERASATSSIQPSLTGFYSNSSIRLRPTIRSPAVAATQSQIVLSKLGSFFVNFNLPLAQPPKKVVESTAVYISLIPFLILLGVKLDSRSSSSSSSSSSLSWKDVFTPLWISLCFILYLQITIYMRLWFVNRTKEIRLAPLFMVSPLLVFLVLLPVYLDSASSSTSPPFSISTVSIPLYISLSLLFIKTIIDAGES